MPLVFGEVDTPAVRDGSLRGVTGPLVKIGVPAYVSYTQGTATVAQSPLPAPAGDNPDGSASLVNMICPAAVPNCAVLRTELYGRVIGVRFLRRAVTSLFPFDVVIDGVAYPVENVVPRWNNQAVSAGNGVDNENLAIIATGLADTVHTVEVHLTPDPALATSNSLFLFGFVVERGRGYNETPPRPRAGYVSGSTTLTAANTAITTSTTQVVAGLSFHNTDAANAHTVTISGPNAGGIYKVISIPAGTSASLTFPSPKNLALWTWKADAASAVTAWMENA